MKGDRKMSQTDKGVLIFSEWFDAMAKLNPREYKSLMNAIYRYQIHGEEPPEFQGKTDMVAAIIFPYIRRRITNASAGKKGMAVRRGAYGINPIIDAILDKRAAKDADNGADNQK